MTRENFMWITQFTQNNFKTSYKLSKLFTESSTFARSEDHLFQIKAYLNSYFIS